MKRKVYSLLWVLPLFLLAFFSGCTKEVYEDNTVTVLGSEIITVEVHANDWYWDATNRRYYTMADFPEIDESVYEYGLINCSVYIKEKGLDGNGKPVEFEVQKVLPAVSYETDATRSYLRTISSDAYLGDPGNITFYVQASDGKEINPAPVEYYFKVTLIRNFKK